MPSDAEMMKVAIADLQDPAAEEGTLLHALQELEVLTTPLDNANGKD